MLPWVRVEHLASKVLAANIKLLQEDWQPIALLETFVEKQRFTGTCYKAANWHCIGEIKGRGQYDRCNRHSAPVKAVYLTLSFRQALLGAALWLLSKRE
ncbi:MAG: DUF4338 domain-containing protein [Desulfobulbaceae bacterium]|nr:DUF4338 domain-containing protein [Desulfobulbaceae bacterium]